MSETQVDQNASSEHAKTEAHGSKRVVKSQDVQRRASEEGISPTYTVSHLQDEDIRDYLRVMREMIETSPFIPEEEKKEYLAERTEEYYKEAIGNPKDWILLAAKDGEGNIVGVLEAKVVTLEDEARWGEKAGYINFTNVDESHRRRGIATKLKVNFEDELRDKGIPYEMTSYRRDNIAGRKLNEKFGLTTPYATKEDRMWYLKPLQ